MKFLIITMILSAQTAFANDELFPKGNSEQPICYGREYSAEELNKKPHQTVKKIQAKLLRYKSSEAESDAKVMQLEVSLTGDKHFYKNYRAYFLCNKEDNFCGIECDGGRVTVQKSKAGNLEITNLGFILEGGCDSPDSEPIMLKKPEEGEEKFELVQLPDPFCQKATPFPAVNFEF